MRVAVRFCCAVLLLGAVTFGFGQQIGPKALDRSFQRPGARALGMGGAYLLATDDATAVAWNPAALAKVKRFTIPIEVAGRVNFDVQDVTDLSDDLETIRDQINPADPASAIAAITNAFNRVRDFSRGRPRLQASLAPIGGLSFGSYGLTASSGLVLGVDTFVDAPTDPIGVGPLPTPNLYARGGAIALTSIGLAHARSFPAGLVIGATIRRVRADFAGFLVGATTNAAAPNPVPGTPFKEVDSSRFTLDVGAIWEPPVQPPAVKVRCAAVVRNLVPSKFNLQAINADTGAIIPGFDFSFRLNPEIDVGVLGEWGGRTIGVLELHNITSSNGGDMTIHAGVEHWLAGNVFAVRVGYDDDRPVAGLGINLKFLRIDVATGAKPRERLAVGISLRF